MAITHGFLPDRSFAATAPPGSLSQVHCNESSAEELLNQLAAIQAAAEILDDHELSRHDRDLFLTVIRTETTRLHRMIAA